MAEEMIAREPGRRRAAAAVGGGERRCWFWYLSRRVRLPAKHTMEERRRVVSD